MSLNGAIDDHKTGDYVVRRTASAPYVHGKPTTGAVTTFIAPASVQPFQGDLSDLAEGQHVENAKTILAYTLNGEVIVPRADGIEPDVFVLEDGEYSVEKCLKWDHWGERHFVITAYKRAPL